MVVMIIVMEVVVSFPLGYMVNVIGQDLSRPNEEWKENSRKRFLSKGATLIVTTMLFASFLITMKQYNHKNKQYHHNEPNHNETIQS